MVKAPFDQSAPTDLTDQSTLSNLLLTREAARRLAQIFSQGRPLRSPDLTDPTTVNTVNVVNHMGGSLARPCIFCRVDGMG